ncbi:MAG TPA: hypothetical protein DCS43_15510, partial [Verrucomicrobia bacterium]|nr:hypothetical protein [Verrucomicrobiota bacterium]
MTRFYAVLALTAAVALAPVCAQAQNTVAPTNATYTLGTTNDVLLVLAPEDGTFSSLTSSGTPSTLTNITHYTVSSTTNFLIKASYLNAQTGATVNLTFVMTNGANPTAAITIAAGNATVSPTTGNHTLGTTNTLAVTVTPNGRSFTKISGPSGDLTGGGTNYTVNGNTYTILASYLNAQAVTNVPLTFVMNGGTSPTTTVSVAAGTASVSPTNATHTLGTTNTLTVALTANGRSFAAIKLGATSLTTNDYANSGNDYTINAAYLNARSVGTNVLTFDVSGGTDPAVAVVVSAGNATVAPPTANHTLGTTNTLPITLTANGRSVTNIHDGTASLTTNNYSVASGVYTIKAAYLNAQEAGPVNLTFQMNGGNNPTTAVTVAAGDATVTPATAGFTLGTTNTIAITLTPNGNAFTNLHDGTASLVETNDYTVSGNVYTIKTAYLDAQTPGTNTLTFQMDGGTDPETAVAIAAGNATVLPASGTFLMGSTNTLTFTVTENGRDFQNINDGTTNLTLATHYTIDNVNEFTILPAYLNAQALGPRPLTFVMDGGISPTGTATIVAGDATVLQSSISRDLLSTNNATFSLTLNGRTLSGVKNGVTTLQTPAHYTVSGGTNVTILA